MLREGPTTAPYRVVSLALGVLLSSHCSLAFPVDDLTEGSSSSATTTGAGGGAVTTASTSTVATSATAATKSSTSGVTSGAFSSSSSASGAGGGSPLPTDALILHLDATSLPIGDRLALWSDASPAGNDATQDDVTLRPSVVDRDGLPAVTFAGMGEHLRLPEGFEDFSAGISIFAVAAFEDGGNCPQLLQLTNGEEIDDVGIWKGTGFGFEIEDEFFEGGTPVPIGTVVSYAARQDALGAVLVTHNTDLVGVNVFMLPETIQRTSNFLGSGLYDTCTSFHGIVHEVLIYQRKLDDAEFATVTDHLVHKWNIP